MVIVYSPMATVFPLSDEALSDVASLLLMLTVLEHSKYFFDRRSIYPKSTRLTVSFTNATLRPFVTLGVTLSSR